MSRALVLISPAASRGRDPSRRERLAKAIDAGLEARGLAAEHAITATALEASDLLHAAAAEGYDLAVMAGGDGSVRLAVHALAGTSLPIAIVPLGTGNLLAATLGVPRDPFAAAARLAVSEAVTIDTGLLEADDTRESFAVAAGVGFDARVMKATDPATKARFGILAYFGTVFRMLGSLPSVATEIVVDDRTYELSTVAVLVANCGQILPGLLGPRAPLDPTDGLLDVVAIRSGTFPTGLSTAASSAINSLLRGEIGTDGPSVRLQGKRITVTTDPPEPVQVDGDLLALGSGTFRATSRPASLTVLV
ncbi:MAG TPA: diacylglycerol kinase family protein [Candidatus Limnocylindrales bacterium]|nr:diacylglycerol kinase family protein [Candidatus Limnocylindrales bacterium]